MMPIAEKKVLNIVVNSETILEIFSKNGFYLLLLRIRLANNKVKQYFIGVDAEKRDELLKNAELIL